MVRRGPPDVEGATRFATSVLLGGIERLGREAGQGSVSDRLKRFGFEPWMLGRTIRGRRRFLTASSSR